MNSTNFRTADDIVYVGINQIHPHPNNVRKKINDIQELTESIKLKGILQNLTIVPINGKVGEYYILIGNRRYEAAKLAGLKELPCQIMNNLSDSEQKGIMLTENMMRDDLTISEQGQAFQMMLDLGETEETISEKTGFSKSTINHRINIAKLDQKTLEIKEQDESFQLNLTDLYALERIPLNKRDKVLKESTSSRELASKIETIVSKEKREKASKKIVAMLQKLGIAKAPDEAATSIYDSSKWTSIQVLSLDEEIPKAEDLKLELIEPIYYLVRSWDILLFKKTKKKKKILSASDLERKHLEINKRQIKTMLQGMAAARKEYIQHIIAGKIKPLNSKDTKKAEALLWQVLTNCTAYISKQNLISFFLHDYSTSTEKERKAAQEKLKNLSLLDQELILSVSATKELILTEWNGTYKASTANTLNNLYQALKLFGFTISSEDEKNLLNGTHKLYVNNTKHEEKSA